MRNTRREKNDESCSQKTRRSIAVSTLYSVHVLLLAAATVLPRRVLHLRGGHAAAAESAVAGVHATLTIHTEASCEASAERTREAIAASITLG